MRLGTEKSAAPRATLSGVETAGAIAACRRSACCSPIAGGKSRPSLAAFAYATLAFPEQGGTLAIDEPTIGREQSFRLAKSAHPDYPEPGLQSAAIPRGRRTRHADTPKLIADDLRSERHNTKCPTVGESRTRDSRGRRLRIRHPWAGGLDFYSERCAVNPNALLSRDRGHAPAADRQPISGLAFMSRQVSRLRSDLPHNSPSARLSTWSTCSSSGPTSPKTCNFARAGRRQSQIGLSAHPASSGSREEGRAPCFARGAGRSSRSGCPITCSCSACADSPLAASR